MARFKLLTPLLWLTALLLATWTFSQLPVASITESLAALTFPQLMLWLGLNLAIILLCNYRWQFLHRIFDLQPRFGRLLLIRQAGQAVSFITPGPQFGGEPLQIYWLYRLCHLPLGKTILALGLDRFFELSVNFCVLLFGVVIVMAFSAEQLTGGAEVAAGLILLLVVVVTLLWFLLRQPQWMTSNLQRLAERWHQHPRLLLLESGMQSMGANLRKAGRDRKADFVKVLLLTLLSWTGLLVELWLVLELVGAHVDLPGFFLVLVSMRLALLLPLPGGIGTLEASLMWSLGSLGCPASAALAMIALMRLRDAIVLGGGLLCLRLVQNRYRIAAARTPDTGLLADTALPG